MQSLVLFQTDLRTYLQSPQNELLSNQNIIQNYQLILHPDPEDFCQWCFISEEVPFKQLCLMSDEE